MAITQNPQVARRIGATVIDLLIYAGIYSYFYYSFRVETGPDQYALQGMAAFFPLLWWFACFVLCECYMGGTIGHQLCGIRVVSRDGKPLGFQQVLLRRLGDILDIYLSVGMLAVFMILYTEHAQRLGDKLAETRVVGKSEAAIISIQKSKKP